MGRLYQAQFRSNSKKGWKRLSEQEKLDLQLHLQFLRVAKIGISMNLLTYQKPSVIYRSDASEFGLGGYNVCLGAAWRFELPTNCRLQTSLNALEFIACAITIWIDSLKGHIADEYCLLSQANSSSASGWLRKLNFSEKEDKMVHLSTARQLAKLVMSTKSCLHSQWFAGNNNCITDSLSHDFHIPDTHLSTLLHSTFSSQAPYGLKMFPLPNKIASWLTSLLVSQPQKEQWSKEQNKSKFMLGIGTNPVYSPLVSTKTSTLMDSTKDNASEYLVPSHILSERVDSILQLPEFSNLNHSVPPWIVWHRPTDWPTDPTLALMQMVELHSFYKDNYEVTQQLTQERNNK